MIVIATFKDEIVDGKGKAAGEKRRHQIVLGADSFNLVIGHRKGENPFAGHAYFSNLDMLKNRLGELDLDVDACLFLTQKAFSRLGESSAAGLSWAELDKTFSVSQRVYTKSGSSTGELSLHQRLKDAGFFDTKEKSEKEELVS